MTDNGLEFMALSWLRFEKACPVALFERTPRYGHGQPDVLGITKARFLLEIEIKRSLSDFKANANKGCLRGRYDPAAFDLEYYGPKWPKQYWFLVPPELVAKVEPLVPSWAGLLRGPGKNEPQGVVSVKPAPTNKESARLTTKEMVRLANCMANQIYSNAKVIQTLRNNFEWGYCPYYWSPEI